MSEPVMGVLRDSTGNRLMKSQFQKVNDKLLRKLNAKLMSVAEEANTAEDKEDQHPTVKMLLRELKEAVYHAEDLIDEALTGDEAHTRKSKSVKLLSFNERISQELHIERKMKEMLQRIEDISTDINSLGKIETGYNMKKEKSPRMSTSSIVDESEIFGFNDNKKEIIEILLHKTGQRFSVIRIVGMGGIGKTALAQIVYNDDQVRVHFELKVWICISDHSDMFSVTKAIFESLISKHCDLNGLDSLQVGLKQNLAGKRFLLVLDDMWNDNYKEWELLRAPFNDAAYGSCVIVTTRSHRVPAMKGTIDTFIMQPLSDEDSWNLFATSAFGDKEPRSNKLEDIREEILSKCGGLPLAIKEISNILGCKPHDEWQDHLLRLSFPSEEMCDVLSTIKLSYNALPTYLKRCFAYCSIFPQGYKFVKEKLVLLWMAEGLLQLPEGKKKRMEEVGDEYFHELVLRSFFLQSGGSTSKEVMPDRRNDTSHFVMHDLLTDLAVSVSGEYCFTLKENFSGISARTRHLSLLKSNKTPVIFEAIHNAKFLRTFLPLDHQSCLLDYNQLKDLFSKLKFLRVLSLSHYHITKLPKSICKLIHLRYVDLSHTALERLPRSVCTLINLQTLILSNCHSLTELPEDLWKLVNLRHLDINGTTLSQMPKKMGKLENLGTLPHFVVGKESKCEELESRHSLSLNQCAIDAVKLSLPLTKFVTESSIPPTEGAVESSLPLSKGATESSLPMNLDATKSSLPLTQGKVAKTVKEISETEGRGGCEEGIGLEIATTSETKGTKQKQKEIIEEGPSLFHFSDERSQLPSTQGVIESVLPPLREGAPKSPQTPLSLAQYFVDTSLPMTQVSKTLKETTETEERGESEEETGLETAKTSETKGTKVEQEEVIEEDPSRSLFSDEKFSLPSTQSAMKSSFPTAEDVVDISFPITQDEKYSLPLTEGAQESFLPLAEDAVYTSVPITQDEKSSFPLAQGAAESLLPSADGVVDTSVPITQVSKALKETTETEERGESEEETGLEIAKTSETKGTKVEQEVAIEEDPSHSLFSDEKFSLPSSQSAMKSSFPTAEDVVDTSFPMTQDEKYSLPLTEGAQESLPLAEDAVYTSVPITQGTEESGEGDEADVLSDTWSNSSFESMEVSEISELMALPRPLHSLKIEGCDDLTFIPESVIKNPSLQHLYIINCCSLESFPYKGMALKILYIRNCKKLYFPLANENIQLGKLEDLSVGSSCDSLTDLSFHLFPELRSLSIWDCAKLQKLSVPQNSQIKLTSLEALEIRDCPNLENFPTGGLPTPNLKSIWFSNCQSLKKLPDQLSTLECLKSMFINDCPELETLSKQVLPSKLSLLRINFCNKLIPRKEWGLHGLASLCLLEIEGGCKNVESFPVEGLLPSNLSSLRISKLSDLKKLDNTGLKKLESLKTLEISCCDKLQFLPEDGFPSSLSFLCIKECPLLKPKLQNKNREDWSKIAHISCIEIDEEVIS